MIGENYFNTGDSIKTINFKENNLNELKGKIISIDKLFNPTKMEIEDVIEVKIDGFENTRIINKNNIIKLIKTCQK